jgi:lysophospholipase L1-like esterase
LVIGDSLSDPKSGGGRYLDAVRTQCSACRIENLARGGWMVNQMRRRLGAFLETSTTPYSHLVVFGGVNDLYSDQTAGRSLGRIEGDLSILYELGRARGMTVVAITVSPWGGFRRWFTTARDKTTRALNRWIVDQVTEGKVAAAVETTPLLGCGAPSRLCPEFLPPLRDGLHFGPTGHERLGQALVRALGGDFCQVSPASPKAPAGLSGHAVGS